MGENTKGERARVEGEQVLRVQNVWLGARRLRDSRIVILSEARNLCHSRRGAHGFPICAATAPLSSSVFHTACALSAPSGHLPLEGKADDARIALAHTAFGHRQYFCSAAPRSFDSVFLFQISHNIRRLPPLRMTKCAASPPLNLFCSIYRQYAL